MTRPYFCLIAVLVGGCALYLDPVVTDRPAPPPMFGTVDSASLFGQCPSIAGEYRSVPEIVESAPDGGWGAKFEGDGHEYVELSGAHLLNIRRPGASREVFSNQPEWDGSSFGLEQEGNETFTLIITNAREPGRTFEAQFEQGLGDFTCKDGEIIFSDYRFEGATEGAYLNELILSSLLVNTSGNILFYEQEHHGRESVRHRYYLYEKIE